MRKALPYIEWFHLLLVPLVGLLLLVSLRWRSISQAFYYILIGYLMLETLYPSPEGLDCANHPLSRLGLVHIFLADKLVPQSVYLAIYWILQYQVHPWIYSSERDTFAAFKTAGLLLSLIILASLIKNLLGTIMCNERVSRNESWNFMTDCAKNVIIIRPEGGTFQLIFKKLQSNIMNILKKRDSYEVQPGVRFDFME